jgi:hypothetical protein
MYSYKKTAYQHALILANGDEKTAKNLMFRCGPCDICGGDCLCGSDFELIKLLVSGDKPIGSFAYQSLNEALKCSEILERKGISTWRGINKWNMYIVVASKNPDTYIEKANGTPREKAYTQNFINEEDLTFVEIGALYGYPYYMSKELDENEYSSD